MDLNLGPAFLRFYANGSNWSHLEVGYVSNRDCGLARRESAITIGFKSEHALELFSVENPADRYIAPDGTVTHGRICVQGSRTYALSAEQVFSAALHKRALQALASAPMHRPSSNLPTPWCRPSTSTLRAQPSRGWPGHEQQTPHPQQRAAPQLPPAATAACTG
jgi:hypothetical protein